MAYWQVSAGYGGESGGGRDYHDVFLDYGVMLIGPGEYGEYHQNRARYEREKDGGDVKRFAEEVSIGDVVVLKRPSGRRWKVLAVGEVKSGYVWLEMFDDVEGWDIQHGRHVEWVKPPEGVGEDIEGLTQGKFRRVHDNKAIHAIDKILRDGRPVDNASPPQAARNVSDGDLIRILTDLGWEEVEAERFTGSLESIRALARWYRDLVRQGVKVREHETRTFLIVPLLQALGWSAEQLKIEWRNVDIAFFKEPYSEESDKCVMILESKKLLESLATKAREQAARYSERYPSCESIIVSDGCSYKLFERTQDHEWHLSAYLNIMLPRITHPYRSEVGGASEVLRHLNGRPRPAS